MSIIFFLSPVKKQCATLFSFKIVKLSKYCCVAKLVTLQTSSSFGKGSSVIIVIVDNLYLLVLLELSVL